jgi:hypothetical protein
MVTNPGQVTFIQNRWVVGTIYGFALFFLIVWCPACKPQQSTAQNANVSSSEKDEPPIVPSRSPEVAKVVGAGQAVPVGYFGYKVTSSKFDGEKTSLKESRLLVELSVVNTGATERALPLLKVVDDDGVEFSADSDAPAGSMHLAEKLAPGAITKGLLAFKVPRDHSYKLKIQDNSSSETVLIELMPSSPPAK